MFYSLAVVSFLLICCPNFGVFTLVLEQSALTQWKYYLPPVSYLENKWRSFCCRTESRWPSLSLVLHIFHYKCFLFSQRILQQRRHFPCVCCFQWTQINVEWFLVLHWGGRSSQAQDASTVLYTACKSSLLLKTAVHGSPQTGLLHFWGFSPPFYLPFPVLPFLSFTLHSPSIFYPRTTRHSSRKHPSINCLSYKPLIS